MDIVLNRNIGYWELKNFLKVQFPDHDFYLIYEGLNDWEDVGDENLIFQYLQDVAIKDGFKYGMCIYIKDDNLLPIIEILSRQLSEQFICSAFCDASRVVLKKQNSYYSLLFEQGKVYLVDDYIWEDTGRVTKIVELTYEFPIYHLD
jgi:hypothetical protein